MAEQVLKRHPVRGFLYGVLFGLGLAMIFVGQGWTALGTWGPFVVFVVGLVLATLWGAFGPAKPPKGPEPVPVEAVTAPPPSRFDDFGEPDDAAPDDTAPDDAVGDDAMEVDAVGDDEAAPSPTATDDERDGP